MQRERLRRGSFNRSEECAYDNAMSSPEKSAISKKKQLAANVGMNASMRMGSKLISNLSKERCASFLKPNRKVEGSMSPGSRQKMRGSPSKVKSPLKAVHNSSIGVVTANFRSRACTET